MTRSKGSGERLPLPLALPAWLARLIEAVAPGDAAARWGLASDYAQWLSGLRAMNGPADEEAEETNAETLVARLLFALSFLVGVVALLITLLIVSIVDALWAVVVAAIVAFVGIAFLVTSPLGEFTNYAIGRIWAKCKLCFDVTFVFVVIGAWLVFALTTIF